MKLVHQRQPQDNARRTLIKALSAGGITAATAKVLPEHWTTAVVDSVFSPVHAQTSPVPPLTARVL